MKASFVFVLLLLSGCARNPGPASLTLYSINGGKGSDRAKSKETGEEFHEYGGVLGKVEITDPAKRQELLEALEQGMAEKDIHPADCFWPRHGLRVVENGKTSDYLICFQCNQVYRYNDGAKTPMIKTISPVVQPVFDKHLRNAGLPLAP